MTAQPPETCNLCNKPIRSGPFYYEAVLRQYDGGTRWTWFCHPCATKMLFNLGTGQGQKYDSTTNEKVEG